MRRCPWPQVACAVTARNVCCPGAVSDRAKVKLEGKRVATPKGARLEHYVELLPIPNSRSNSRPRCATGAPLAAKIADLVPTSEMSRLLAVTMRFIVALAAQLHISRPHQALPMWAPPLFAPLLSPDCRKICFVVVVDDDAGGGFAPFNG